MGTHPLQSCFLCRTGLWSRTVDCQPCTYVGARHVCRYSTNMVCHLYSYPITTPDLFGRASFGRGDAPTISIGAPGSGSRLYAAAEFNIPRGLHASPWCATCVLVADSGNNRVVEVDVPSGLLTKVMPRYCVLPFSSPRHCGQSQPPRSPFVQPSVPPAWTCGLCD
jgi:hypothetical protein